MKIDDEAGARSEARSIVRDLADQHRKKLVAMRRPSQVWTDLAAPLAAARKRFQHRVAGSLREHGIFEAAVHEELVAPLEARLAHEQATEDSEAVRDADYRAVSEQPRKKKRAREKPEPKPESAPSPPSEPRVDPLADQRNTSWIFIGVGVLAAFLMGAIALAHSSGETFSAHVRATFVPARCSIIDTKEEQEEGGGHYYKIRFRNVAGDQSYINDRYSPDVAHPSMELRKPGDEVECYCDPKNPAVCFLYKGQETNREEVPWMYVLVLPGLFLGIGLWMRFSPTELNSSD